jgi:CheY-like chemotaxis protein
LDKEKTEVSAEAKQETVANPTTPESEANPKEIEEDESADCALPAESPEQFFATVAADLAKMRKFVSQGSGDADPTTSLQNLRELLREVRSLKNKASLPELLPIWQTSAALEGLLNQLVEKPASISPSNLNTISGAVELLQTLSVPGLKPDLVTEPPLRVLAVDDDAICRHAVSFALKKALNAPQLESNPTAALALAEKQPYDVILLDVEMPGMDGFELCSRIRKTELNRDTPVLFVTRHGDYESQAKSTLVGGQDLIAKPFLIFEITVKTLTLLVRGRLKSKKVEEMPKAKAES